MMFGALHVDADMTNSRIKYITRICYNNRRFYEVLIHNAIAHLNRLCPDDSQKEGKDEEGSSGKPAKHCECDFECKLLHHIARLFLFR